MAQRLVAAGESVTFVGLIDYAGPRLQYSLRERISDHLMYMRTLPWPGRLDYLMRWVKHRLGVKDAKETESIAPTEQANSAFLESSLHALQSYVVRPYPGHVSLFRARQGSPSVLADPQGGWGGFTAGFEVFDVSGTHTTITHPPHVHDLGDALARALQNSDRRARDQASETSSKS
jgi:thioesterase domain-containing protein